MTIVLLFWRKAPPKNQNSVRSVNKILNQHKLVQKIANQKTLGKNELLGKRLSFTNEMDRDYFQWTETTDAMQFVGSIFRVST